MQKTKWTIALSLDSVERLRAQGWQVTEKQLDVVKLVKGCEVSG